MSYKFLSTILGIDANFTGNVGVGTTTPASKVQTITDNFTVAQTYGSYNNAFNQIAGSSNQGLLGSYSSTLGSYIASVVPGSGWKNMTYIAFDHIFQIAGVTAMTIKNSTNNVLIGTTTDAGYKLDVNGTLRVLSGNGSRIEGGGSFTATGFCNFNGAAQSVAGTNCGLLNVQSLLSVGYQGAVGTSAVVDIRSTTLGFLKPRMTTTQRDAIATPATGLAIYNTTTNTEDYYNGTAWVSLQTFITNPVTGTGTTNYLSKWTSSSTLNTSLVYDNGTNVGIGTTSPAYKLDVYSSSFNILNTASAYFVETAANSYRTANLISYGGYNTGGYTNTTGDVFAVGGNNSSTANANSFFRLNFNGGNSTGAYGASGNNSVLAQLNATTSATLYLTAQGEGGYLNGTTNSPFTLSTYSAGTNLSLRSDRGLGSSGGGINYYSSINGANHSHKWFHNNSEQMRLAYTGNLLINTTTDAGYKLDVNGTGRFQNTLYTQPNITISSTNGYFLGNTGGNITNTLGQITFQHTTNLTSGTAFAFSDGLNNGAITDMYGNRTAVLIKAGFKSPNSTWTFNNLEITSGYVNGGMNITARGLYYNPDISSLTGTYTHRAIETVTGDVYFASTSGNVGIGVAPSNGTKLNVNGDTKITGSTSTGNYSLSVYNSSNAISFYVRGYGDAFLANTLYLGTLNGSNFISNGSLGIASSQGAGNPFITFIHNNGNVAFKALSNSVLQLNPSAGNVLVGTTTDSGQKLQVTGTAKVSSLGGGGTQMVITDNNGQLSTQAIPTIPSKSFGAFQEDTTQVAPASNVGYGIKFSIADISGHSVDVIGDSHGDNTLIKFDVTGVYNIQFSCQFQNTDSQLHDISIWLRKNGENTPDDVPATTGFISVPNKHGGVPGHCIAAWNYFVEANSGDFFQLVWSTTDNINVTMEYYAAGSPPPSAASAILTVNQVD